MGLYDTVNIRGHCPYCGSEQQWSFQYKYGHCRVADKKVGDEIQWSHPKYDFGPNLGGTVAIDGLDECDSCQRGVYSQILVAENRIAGVTLVDEQPPEFEIVEKNPSYIRFSEPPSELLSQFIELCGPRRLYQLFVSLSPTPETGRLRYWHEQLIREFNNKTGNNLSLDPNRFIAFLSPITKVFEKAEDPIGPKPP